MRPIAMPSAEMLTELFEIITVPTLVQDDGLRQQVASTMGWTIDPSYFADVGEPWAHGYWRQRYEALEEACEPSERQTFIRAQAQLLLASHHHSMRLQPEVQAECWRVAASMWDAKPDGV